MATRFRIHPAVLVVAAFSLPVVARVYQWATRPAPRELKVESIASGRELFNHEWKPKDKLSGGDGLGPVFNARSCLECHNQGGPGGGGPVDMNVTVYGLTPGVKPATPGIAPIGVVHFKATEPKFQETLSQVLGGLPGTPRIELPVLVDRSFRAPTGVSVTQRNTPALFGDGLLDVIPEDSLHAEQRRNSTAARLVGMSKAKDPNIRGRVARLPDGRLGRFGWKAEFATLNEFVKAACANELGLSNPGRPQATPFAAQTYKPSGTDLTDAQCQDMTDFISSLEQPSQVKPYDPALRAHVDNGEKAFASIGCADCHTPDLGPIKGFYSNLLLHDMGADLASSTGYYGEAPAAPSPSPGGTPIPVASEWKTPPLWGVADSAPYLHDGRAKTLDAAIIAHAGEAKGVVANYNNLKQADRDDVVEFLKTLRSPKSALEPARTASR
jgi:CxxC motif-containing protein (DUF1111 family)